MELLDSFKIEFERLVGFYLTISDEYRAEAEALCQHLARHDLVSEHTRKIRLISHINSKFELNRGAIGRVFATAAGRGVVFNFHEKNLIQRAFDTSDRQSFALAMEKVKQREELFEELLDLFHPISERTTFEILKSEVENPSKLRIEKGNRDIGNEILLSAFSSYLFSVAEPETLHAFFDVSYRADEYRESFWLQLRALHPQLYSRMRTLELISVDQSITNNFISYLDILDALFSKVAESYTALENHGHLAFWIEPIHCQGRNITWELCSDLMLYAEKHYEVELKSAYFRHRQIALDTLEHIADLDPDNARFNIANEGFSYKDTFVFPVANDAPMGTESILLLLQKNKRDETLIQCPACRSHKVQGNSYPTLGVRSWECGNVLCPDRSKYNRGKRYSFKALLMQEAIGEADSQIPASSVRNWSRDVQIGRTVEEAAEMLIRHYSLHGDGVLLSGIARLKSDLGRRVSYSEALKNATPGVAEQFFDSAWFHRYAFLPRGEDQSTAAPTERMGAFTLVHGDSATALQQFEDEYFDGAVTSPPYYNAREYSQWRNIYCYLRDMQKIAAECFRVLKPGSPYLYNIFDYFANERSITFSAMGEKRVILSAYTVDIFRRVGFELMGNIVWDKGEIEGKRGFNAGNFSPYYQAPFNCWEHILVFRKPGNSPSKSPLVPSVLRAQPVVKMVRGQNCYGHTAPYPAELPELLKRIVPPGGRVLDPFGGSGTTARAMIEHASETVCVERMEEYSRLSLQMYAAELEARKLKKSQSVLFHAK